MKRQLVVLGGSLAVLLALTLAGCGGSSGGGQGAGTGTGTGSPPATSPAAVQGADTNSDGLWDSVEAKIEDQYGASPERKSSARGLASALQMAVLSGAAQGDATTAQQAVSKASKCLFQTFGEQGAYEAADFVEAQVTDTEERVRAYLQFNYAQAGHTSSFDPAVNYCQ
jgi:hypothetical protein